MKITVLFIMVSLAFCTSSLAAEKEFLGGTDSNWNNAANWDIGLPADGDDVKISATCVMRSVDSITITLNSLQVTINGNLTVEIEDSIYINNTIDVDYLTYCLDIIGGATINGFIKIINSIDGGARIFNTTLNGNIEVSSISSGYEPAHILNSNINGVLKIDNNLTTTLNCSIRIGGISNVNPGSSIELIDVSRKAIRVLANSTVTLYEKINFPENITKTCIESYGTLINNDSLFIAANPANFFSAFINRGTFINNGYVHFPLNSQHSWDERGTFTNESCAFIKLEGSLFCTNFNGPAYITNKGIIQSIDNGGSNHYYGGSHNFFNLKGIVADPGSRFSADFNSNTGIKTKKMEFSNCATGEFINVYKGTLANVTSTDFFLDSLLTILAATFDDNNNKVLLNEVAIGENKFFVELINIDDSCSIVTPILVDDFLSIKGFYADLDQDGFGDNSDVLASCGLNVQDRTLINGDCDDENPNIHPDAIEFCDGIDSNCDGSGTAPGQEEIEPIVFTGTINNDWHTSGNWSLNSLPNYCSEVTIPSGKITHLNLSPDTINSLIIQPNGRINVDQDLTILLAGNTGLTNEGIVYGPMKGLRFIGTSNGFGIENLDSIYLKSISLENLSEGIFNYEDGSVKAHNMTLKKIEIVGIENEGLFNLSTSTPPGQSLIEISNIEEVVINNYGDFIMGIDYWGGNEGLEEDGELENLIYNAGILYLNNLFSITPINTAEFPILNEGNIYINGECELNGGLELGIGEFSSITIGIGGKLILKN